ALSGDSYPHGLSQARLSRRAISECRAHRTRDRDSAVVSDDGTGRCRQSGRGHQRNTAGGAPVSATVSIIIPVYNEEGGLAELFARLYPALDRLQRAYEVIFVDYGSHDRSVALLREQFARRPDVTRIVILARNAGQHMAILAGFEHSRGDYVITLDADLQNPPEEITKLVAAMDTGADYVGTVRVDRHDVMWRKAASRLMNRIRERTTQVRITDQG